MPSWSAHRAELWQRETQLVPFACFTSTLQSPMRQLRRFPASDAQPLQHVQPGTTPGLSWCRLKLANAGYKEK